MIMGACISDAGMLVTQTMVVKNRTAFSHRNTCNRSIPNGHDVIVNAQPSIVTIPILQQVYGVIYFLE